MPRFCLKATITVAICCCIAIASGLPADADSKVPSTGIESTDTLEKLGEKTKDAGKFLQELVEKLKNVDDYWYESEVFTYPEHSRTKVESGKFYFKKENRVRVEATSGRNNGSIVVRRKDGLVRAKAGPMLLGITMTLHEDSALLNAGDGTNVLHSDLLSQMMQLHSNIRAGSKGIVTVQPVSHNTGNVMVMDVCSTGDVPVDRIIVNAATGLPVELIHYERGAVFSRTMVKNLKVNSSLADGLFEI